MCFRPAASVTIVKCLECGTFNKPTEATCKKCGTDLTASKEAAAEAAGVNAGGPKVEISLTPKGLDDASTTPSAPKAPGGPPKPPAPKA